MIAFGQIGQALGDTVVVRIALDHELEDRVLGLGGEGKGPVFVAPAFPVQHESRRLPRLEVDPLRPVEDVVVRVMGNRRKGLEGELMGHLSGLLCHSTCRRAPGSGYWARIRDLPTPGIAAVAA